MRCVVRKVACVVTAALALCLPGPTRAGVATPTPLFVNGTHGYACYRIPALVTLPDGTLLAFAEGRHHTCGDFGNVQIVLRASHDDGKTWGAMRVVARNGTLQAGNASPVVDTLDPRFPRGRVILVYCTGDAPERDVIAGHGTRRVWYVASTDDGATWSAPVDITASVKRPSWNAYATGPGHALQLKTGPHSGRIIVAANHTVAGDRSAAQSEANTFYSDDHGRTWHLGATLDVPGTNESTVAQGPRGTLVMNSRDQTGASRARIIAISHDGGAHWATHFIARDLPDPVCQGSMLGYTTPSGQRVLLFSNPGSASKRIDLTISASLDGGHTWPKRTLIHAGPSAYSDITVIPGGKLGIVFEHGSDAGIWFVTQRIATLS